MGPNKLGPIKFSIQAFRKDKKNGMIEIRCSALLFDMDGVLINSTPVAARVWARWASAHGFDPDMVVEMAHGRPSRQTIRELMPNSDVDAEDKKVERMEMDDVEGVVLLPGTRELLDSLPPNRWTIATSCTRPLAEVRLRAAGLPVPAKIVTSSEVKIGKPDPEPYLKAAAKLGYAASDCIVAEDVKAGVESGKAAGARVVAFTTTLTRHEILESAPDWIVENCASIKASSDAQGLRLTLSM